MLEPTSVFCCGCSLRVGIPIIMGLHLLACFFYIGAAFSNIVLHVATFGSTWGLVTQMWLTGLYLCGIPIIISGLYGVATRIEAHVRIYYVYLLACFVIDTAALIYSFVWEDPCRSSGSFIQMLSADFGAAFVCGLSRIFSYAFAIVTISMEAYCLYIVWSFIEEVRTGSSGPWLWELVPGKDGALNKLAMHNGDGEETDFDVVVDARYKLPSSYGALQGYNRQPSNAILGGTEHNLNYAPVSLL